MQIVDLRTTQIQSPTALALGYFDTFHIGHQKLLNRVLDSGYTPAMFTFTGDFYAALGLDRRPIFDERYRMQVAEQCGLEYVFTLPAERRCIEMSAEDFLQLLLHAAPAMIVCGEDFRYGKNAVGGVPRLEQFCRAHHIRLVVLPLEHFSSGTKISTSFIAEMLDTRHIVAVNYMLGRDYMIEGVVEHGRGMGADLGFPTANFRLDPSLQPIADGVYGAVVRIEGKQYKAVCNVGAHPTVDDMSHNVETYVIGYMGDLYGKRLQVYLRTFIRRVRRFDNVQALVDQIKEDVEHAKKDSKLQ